ncbi:isochorismatase family protein [Nocardia sp. NPDC051052]|uniref:isochorismatase family protein n=1 Tax=Nocardia sp. NPDC051052 TaxID=3364322 RepID=UPI00379AA963
MALSTLDARTALILIDLQKGTAAISGAPHSMPDIIARAAELADAFRAHRLPVILVRVSGAPDGSDFAQGRTDAPRRTGGTRPEGWDVIVDELAGHAEDLIVTKRNVGAFYGTDLELHLRRRGITQLVLAGVATSMGVESTVRAAHDHGYHVTLATDATTDMDEAVHRHSVDRVLPRFAETGSTAEILELLDKTR